MIGETIIEGNMKVSIEIDIDASDLMTKVIRSYMQARAYGIMGDLTVVKTPIFGEILKINQKSRDAKIKLLDGKI